MAHSPIPAQFLHPIPLRKNCVITGKVTKIFEKRDRRTGEKALGRNL
jgi:hypothetical protein